MRTACSAPGLGPYDACGPGQRVARRPGLHGGVRSLWETLVEVEERRELKNYRVRDQRARRLLRA